MSNNFDGIIFDVDGTLWDTTPVVEKAWNAALLSMGIDDVKTSADQLKGLFGLPMDVIIENIMPDKPKKVQEDYLPICSKYEFDYLGRESGVLYPQILEVMRELSKKVPLFIVSNCQSGYIELFMERTQTGDIIKEHLCPGDTDLLKADNIKMIVKNNNLKNPVYVGDTQMDANACKEAGVPIIFAAYGFGNVKEPDFVINSPKELLDIC